MIIEELNLDSDEETLISTSNVIEHYDISDDYDGDVFYSYPYFSNNDFDYQFRITLASESIRLEEIKCNETDLNSTETIKVLREYP